MKIFLISISITFVFMQILVSFSSRELIKTQNRLIIQQQKTINSYKNINNYLYKVIDKLKK